MISRIKQVLLAICLSANVGFCQTDETTKALGQTILQLVEKAHSDEKGSIALKIGNDKTNPMLLPPDADITIQGNIMKVAYPQVSNDYGEIKYFYVPLEKVKFVIEEVEVEGERKFAPEIIIVLD